MNRILVVLTALLAAPLLSGCASPETYTSFRLDAQNLDIPPYTWRPPVVTDGNATPLAVTLPEEEIPWGYERLIPTHGAEPNVGVTSSGAIFVTSFESVYRSRDHGATWELVHEFISPRFPDASDQYTTADPMLWVDPDTDRVFINHMHPGVFCTYMIWSDDEGDSWFERPYDCVVPGNDHQKVMTAKPGPKAPPIPTAGYENLVYLCLSKLDPFLTGRNYGTWCSVSYDGGLTFAYERLVHWDATEDPNPFSGWCPGINGHPAAYPDGTVVVPLTGAFGCGKPFRVGVTEDNGLTWETRTCSPDHVNVEIDPDITVTPDGTAYALFRGADQMAYLARSTDKFLTCDVFRVSPRDHTLAAFTAITSGDDGRVAMAYLGTRDDQGEDGSEPSAATPGTEWHLFVTFTADAGSENPTFTTLQVTPDEDPMQVGCIWMYGGNHPCRNLLDFIDMVHGPDGRWIVGAADGCTPRNGCAGTPDMEADYQSRDRQSAVFVQDRGVGLFADKGVLPSLGLSHPAPQDR